MNARVWCLRSFCLIPWTGPDIGNRVSWPDGRCCRSASFARRDNAGGRGKSGLRGNRVPDNVRRGRPQGKCHRKQTALTDQLENSRKGVERLSFGVRVKGCGKSAPRFWQQKWQGKPHPEQDQIGMSRPVQAGQVRFHTGHSGWLLEASGNRRPR